MGTRVAKVKGAHFACAGIGTLLLDDFAFSVTRFRRGQATPSRLKVDCLSAGRLEESLTGLDEQGFGRV
jgi:hypothetical protein